MSDGSTAGRKKQIIIYGLSILLIFGGLGGILEGGRGLLSGPVFIITGLFLLPATRPHIINSVKSAGGPDLSTIGRGTFIAIIVVGLIIGGALAPPADSPSADSPDASTSPSGSTDAPDSTSDSSGSTESPSESSTDDASSTADNDSDPGSGPSSDNSSDSSTEDSSTSDPNSTSDSSTDGDSDSSVGSSTDGTSDSTSDSSTDDSSDSTSDSSSDDDSPDSSDSSTDSSQETSWTVTVLSVTDGDTMDVRMPDGSTDTIRLLGVDTPETSAGNTQPDEWDGIPDNADGRSWLDQWGGKASEYAEERLGGQEIYIEVDEQSDRRGSYDRLLVYAYQSESSSKSFNLRLIENGYARMYDTQFTHRSEHQSAESTARNNNVGVWGYSGSSTPPSDDGADDSSLTVSNIHADAPGNDHDNLNEEYIELTNNGDAPIDMTGWTLADDADHTYYFPSGFELGAGESVTIYSGSGSNSGTELYWGSGSAIWNNGGDTIILKNSEGETVINREY